MSLSIHCVHMIFFLSIASHHRLSTMNNLPRALLCPALPDPNEGVSVRVFSFCGSVLREDVECRRHPTSQGETSEKVKA